MSELSQNNTKDGKLLPCPFCGGEADVIDYDDECWVAHQCANGTAVETDSYETVNEAIAAWNTRANDTLKPEKVTTQDNETVTTRTCHDTDANPWHFTCSACGYEQNGYETWNYCPNCGARVKN